METGHKLRRSPDAFLYRLQTQARPGSSPKSAQPTTIGGKTACLTSSAAPLVSSADTGAVGADTWTGGTNPSTTGVQERAPLSLLPRITTTTGRTAGITSSAVPSRVVAIRVAMLNQTEATWTTGTVRSHSTFPTMATSMGFIVSMTTAKSESIWHHHINPYTPNGVINAKFLLVLPHQKYYITQYKELGFSHILLRWKMIILPTFTTWHFISKSWENVLFELGNEIWS